MSNDVSRFDWMICFIHNLWIAPLGSVIAGWLIFNQIGFAGLIGCAVLIITMPMQGKPWELFSLKL
jgi:ATP-binding cassette, subfamily C (CFTR/MRP), member 4